MAKIKKIKLGGTTYDLCDADALHAHQTIKQDGVTGSTSNRYGVCSTAVDTAAKTVSITKGTFSLETGARVTVKFGSKNTANSPTLNVNSTGAKNIFHNGAQITSGTNKGMLYGTVDFVYDGTQWHLVGNYVDTDTNTHNSHAVISGLKADNSTQIKGSASSSDITLGDSGVTAGTYRSVTVNSKGIVVAGSSTDADTNTWRKVQLNGTDKLGTGTNTNPLNIKAGSNMTITESNGTFTFSATDTNTDTHYTASLHAGAKDSTTNATSDTSNPYLVLRENSTNRSQLQIQGSGATTVSTKNGIITINSTDTNTDTKVTAVGNHYTPAADTSAELTAAISGTAGAYAKDTEYTVLTGVKAQRDAKGHVTGITYTAQKIKDTNTTYTIPTVNNAKLTLKVGNQTVSGNDAFTANDATDTTYNVPSATADTYGVVKVSSVNSSAVTVNSESTTAGRYYPVELNSDGKAIVNVPWTDTDTNTHNSHKINSGKKSDNSTDIVSAAASSGDITLGDSGVTAGTYKRVTVNAKGIVVGGDNTDSDTHYTKYLQIKGNGTEAIKYTQDSDKSLNLKPGDNVSISATAGEITISATDTNTWRPIGTGATDAAAGNHTHAYTPNSVLPNDNGEIKTKYRIAKKDYTGGATTYWYYEICKLPKNDSGNYASAIISGRIGGWESGNMSYINALIWNRGTPGLAVIDVGGTATAASSIWNICDLVLYTNSDGTATLYAKCANWFTFDLDLELFQSTATISYSGNKLTSVSGTLNNSASATTSRMELISGELYVAGTKMPKADTWRGIQNNLTSDSTTDSLSAKQGKELKALIDGKADASHGTHVTAATVKTALGVGTGTSKYLREDGTWVIPYSNATTSAAGLMSKDDKSKLDGIATGATKVTTDTVSGWGYTKNTGTVTQVKVGTTAYDPSSGIVSIPAYPTSLKNPNSITIKAGSDTVSSYDGSAAKTFTIAASTTAGAFTISDGTTTKTVQLAGKFTDTNTDTNTTYDLSAAKSKSNGSVTLDLTAGGSGSGTDSVTIKGTGATTVTTDANGVITINSTDNNTDTNTSHSHSAGVGLVGSGSAGTSGGTYDYKVALVNETKASNASSYTAGAASKFYSVQLDKDGKLAVNVPWTDTNTDTNTATAADNILDGSNSGTQITYAPYSSQQSKLSFDTSSTNPTRTDRLNINGYLYGTKLYSGGKEVITDISGKQDKLTAQTAYSSKGSATKVPQITTNSLGQVTGITEVTITQPTVNNAKLTLNVGGAAVSGNDAFTANDSTDTTYNVPTATSSVFGVVKTSTGITNSSGTISVAYGTTAGTACQGNDSRLSDARTPTSHSHGNITNDGKLGTASRVVVTDSNKKITVASSITTTELDYLDGVTSKIQTQLDNKAASNHTHTTNDAIYVDSSNKIHAAGFHASSDRRLKENIKEFVPQKSILDLPVVEFDFKATKNHTIGCIAQDLQEICPELVATNDSGFLSIEESKLTYLLLIELKKLKKETEDLKAELDTLKNIK